MTENQKLAENVVQDHDDDVGREFDNYVIHAHAVYADIHDQKIQTAGCQTSGEERSDFLQDFAFRGCFAVEDIAPVGQICGQNRKDPGNDRAWHRRDAKRMGAYPVRHNIDDCRQYSEYEVPEYVFVFFVEFLHSLFPQPRSEYTIIPPIIKAREAIFRKLRRAWKIFYVLHTK